MSDVEVEQRDDLKITLTLLHRCTKETRRAIDFLGKAEETSVSLPEMPICHLNVGDRIYSVGLTSYQCGKLKAAGTEYDDVLTEALELLVALSGQVSEAATDLMTLLIGPDGLPKQSEVLAPQPVIPLGCCTYSGGTIPKLSKTQCEHYHPTDWDQNNPNCTR